MIDSLFENFGSCLGGIATDVRTLIFGGLSIMFILIGFQLLLNVFNMGRSASNGGGRSRDNDNDL